MIYTYILLLENNKYYIGKTKDPKFRLEDHFCDNGCEWTLLHKPIKIIKIIDNCDKYEENKQTFIYMEKYGMDNVRGGIFCQINLSKEDKFYITKTIDGINDNCYNCGEANHFVNDCYALKDVNGYNLSEPEDSLSDASDDYNNNCYKCGRSSHYSNNCYALKDIDGYFI